MEFLRFLDVVAALFQSFVVRKIPELMEQRHCFAPVRYGALRVAGGRISKSLLGFLVLEGVEERDGFFDRGLHFRGATRREIHFAELLRRRGRQGICSDSRGLKSKKEQD